MTLTDDFVKELEDLARRYDAAPPGERGELGRLLDEKASLLSPAQLDQVSRMLKCRL